MELVGFLISPLDSGLVGFNCMLPSLDGCDAGAAASVVGGDASWVGSEKEACCTGFCCTGLLCPVLLFPELLPMR